MCRRAAPNHLTRITKTYITRPFEHFRNAASTSLLSPPLDFSHGAGLETRGDLISKNSKLLLSVAHAVGKSGRAEIARAQLARMLGGDQEVTIRTASSLGYRRFDVWVRSRRLGVELKFGSDPLVAKQLDKDVSLMESGGILVNSRVKFRRIGVEYDFVQDPVSKKAFHSFSPIRLKGLGIPFRIWDPNQFWNR